MKSIFVVLVQLLIIGQVHLRELEDEDYARLPRLFQLDDYDRCFWEKNGVYCLGKFQIYKGLDGPNPLFDLIQEVSQNKFYDGYNRTFVHRGLCLNTRCHSDERNVSVRFERCVDQWAQARSLRTRLHTLHYCHTTQDIQAPIKIDIPRLLFLLVISIILLFNVVGTVYDYRSKETAEKKNALLMAWSIRANWRYYVAERVFPDSRLRWLNSMEIIRVCLMFMIVLAHSMFAVSKVYPFEAREVEKVYSNKIMVFFEKMTAVGQLFILFLSFFTTMSLLIKSKKGALNFKLLPEMILKRFIRLWPMYTIGIAFAATWWVDVADGPLWPLIVQSESNACRSKFLPHIFFLQNYIRADEICLLATWILAVEWQLYLFTVILILTLVKYKYFNVRVLLMLYMAAVTLTFTVIYMYNLEMAYNYNTPENWMSELNKTTFYKDFYIKPINCLAMCIAGIIFGYVHHNLTINKDDNEIKQLFSWFSRNWSWVPIISAGAILAAIFRYIPDSFVNAFIMTSERVLVALIAACFGIYFSSHIKDNEWMYLSIWQYLSRLLYAVGMIHWQINTYLIARRRTLFELGILNALMYGGMTLAISLILALPITILFDFPLQKTLSTLVSFYHVKKTKHQ